MTHLYNAGESPEALLAYQRALSKLVNSLSWGSEIINPRPIDLGETVFYIDLRDYEWDIGDEIWTQIEEKYPYSIDFDLETQAGLHEKMMNLRQEMDCEVLFVHVDWFLATASLPPLYHEILGLPETDRELERRLGIDVTRNLQNAPGVRVWRAGFNDSGVSNHNRVVERHKSQDGAYWKSYDFSGSVGTQNIFTHPLSFKQDGGEIIFNLPNGLQAYYIADASGNRINEAPIEIVSDPTASDPVVRNGLSCIGCHTEGIKTFKDQVRAVVEKAPDSPAKVQGLRLYVEQSVMDVLLNEDKERYRVALEKTGNVFGGIEPVHRFFEAFQEPLDAAHAAAAVGLETETFLEKILNKQRLRDLGLTGLLEGGKVSRDAWTSNFSEVVFALNSPDDPVTPPVDQKPDLRPGDLVFIPDPNLSSAIEGALGKASGALITAAEMATLERVVANNVGITNLTGIEAAQNLEQIEFSGNAISNLSPLAGLTQLKHIKLRGNKIADVSPLADLLKLESLGIEANAITDLAPLQGLVRLKTLGISGNPVSDVSPLASLVSLTQLNAWRTPILDFSSLAKLPTLRWIEFGNDKSISVLPSFEGLNRLKGLVIGNCSISNIVPLSSLTGLTELNLNANLISDISSLAKLTKLEKLSLESNVISDVSPLSDLRSLTELNLGSNRISDVSTLANLTELRQLHLQNNVISDISHLAGLTNLKRLNLRNNSISDFSPLDGLSKDTFIDWQGNPCSLLSKTPKIQGPWLWMIVPTDGRSGSGAAASGIDFLAQMSNGVVTELKVATEGATGGTPVGDIVWTAGKLSPIGSHNINALVNAIGLGSGDISFHVAYGSIALDSPREQETTMLVGSDDAVKVWLNGELVYSNPTDRGADDYQEQFPVVLKEGTNILLVAVYQGDGGWSGFFGFEDGTEYALLPPQERFYFSTESTHFEIGDTFTLHLNTRYIADLAGWQGEIIFDPAVLNVDSLSEGNFLKQNDGKTYFRSGTINNETGRINGLSSTRISEGGVNGEGVLLLITFTAKADGESKVALRRFIVGSNTGERIPSISPEISIIVEGDGSVKSASDANQDGTTNILDMVLVARHFGKDVSVEPNADVNQDGTIDIFDLILVAQNLGKSTGAAAPAIAIDNLELNPAMVQAWITQAETENDGSLAFRQGIANLQRLLTVLLPEKTVLLPNYPNPFNPETWIPYYLAEAADVAVHIYAADGILVRTLTLGHQIAGIYESRYRAAYWDGKNEVGEFVASGVYFYKFIAGDFTATRRMLILK